MVVLLALIDTVILGVAPHQGSLVQALTLYHVDPAGEDSPLCGPPASPCATLAHAVALGNEVPTNVSEWVSVVMAAGQYGPSSCGANASRALFVCGSTVGICDTGFVQPEGLVTVSCGGFTGPVLATNAPLVVSGVTFADGVLTLVPLGDDDGDYMDMPGGGGGCLSVALLPTVNGAQVQLTNVVFSNCTVAVGDSSAGIQDVAGGGGFYLSGGGNNTAVALVNVTLSGCGVRPAWGYSGGAAGGGALLLVGMSSLSTPTVGVSVLLQHVVVVDNFLGDNFTHGVPLWGAGLYVAIGGADDLHNTSLSLLDVVARNNSGASSGSVVVQVGSPISNRSLFNTTVVLEAVHVVGSAGGGLAVSVGSGGTITSGIVSVVSVTISNTSIFAATSGFVASVLGKVSDAKLMVANLTCFPGNASGR